MTKYETLAASFINKIKTKNHNTSKVFRLNKQGNRVVNKRTGIYILIKKEVNFLLEKYSKQSVKDIIGIYNKSLISNDLIIQKNVLKTIFMPYYIEINNEYKASIEHRTNNAILIKNGQQLIDLAVEYISTYDYKKITIGLAILTGRRTSEILKTASFKVIDNAHIQFTGQLKQNNSKAYTIPVLCDSGKIVEALDNLRIIKAYDTIKSVNSKESSLLNQMVKKNLKVWHVGLKMHDLRRFYAYVCYHYKFYNESKQGNRQTFDGYTMEILGHKIIKSGQAYRTLEVKM